MNDNKFQIFLTVAVLPQIIDLIMQNSCVDEWQALSRFYHSRLYRNLSDESSKLWHFSPLMLYTMFQDELLTGNYNYPEVGL